LSAQPLLTAKFHGWTGDCSGTGDCVVTMTANLNVIAHFSLLGLLNASSSEEGSGALVRSSLDVPQGRAEVSLNGRSVLFAGPGRTQASVTLQAGDNFFEGWLREGGATGSGGSSSSGPRPPADPR
jgi:hypothetical protein